MSNYAISLKRTGLLLAALAFTALLLVVNFASFFGNAHAASLTSRSLTLSSTLVGTEAVGAPGSETNGAAANYAFAFTVPTSATALSILVRFCTTPLLEDTCTAPTDMVATSAALGAVTNLDGDWDIGNATANTVRLDHDNSGEDINGATTFVLENIENPSVTGTFFARISTHTDTTPDTTTWADLIDDGTVASAITEGIEITARVKETLGFSTTGTVIDSGTGIVDPDGTCDPLTGSGVITLGDPVENALSLEDTYFNYSAFRTYTNALNGMTVTYEAAPLRIGAAGPDIDAIGGTAAAVNVAGSDEQFGLAADGLVGGNTDIPVNSLGGSGEGDFTYADLAAAWTGGDAGELVVPADYADGGGDVTTADPTFAFVADSPQNFATSTGYVDCVTVPVRYIANIEPLTNPGTYTTTVVWTAIPTY